MGFLDLIRDKLFGKKEPQVKPIQTEEDKTGQYSPIPSEAISNEETCEYCHLPFTFQKPAYTVVGKKWHKKCSRKAKKGGVEELCRMIIELIMMGISFWIIWNLIPEKWKK